MSHHRIIVPMITDRPTSAGKWMFTGIGLQARHENQYGVFEWYERYYGHHVIVTETPGAGRLCKELRMGGSIHCGLAPWSGEWRKA